MGRTRLKKLRVTELSGVDDPANELPGWLVMKSRDVLSDVERFEKAIGGLHDALSGADADVYFSDAPDEIVKARADLIEHLAHDVEEDDSPVVEKNSDAANLFKQMFNREDVEKAGAYDEPGPDSDQVPTGTLEGRESSSAPRVDELPGESEGESPGAGQDKQDRLDLSQGREGTSSDKYGREVDDETGEVLDEGDEPEGADEPDTEPADGGTKDPDEVREAEEQAAAAQAEADEDKAGDGDEDVDFASPEAEQAAKDANLDLEPGEGSGEGGAYTVKDVRAAAKAEAEKNTSDEDGDENVEKFAKSVAGVLESELSPIRDALSAVIDRVENVEKAAAVPQGVTLDDLDPQVPNDVGETGIAKALTVALKTGKVELV